MRIVRITLFAGLALLLGGSSVYAQSPCCAAADGSVAAQYVGKRCQAIDSAQLAGCIELGDVCAGGAPTTGRGCICVGETCVSDGSVGQGEGTADARTCTRDAVSACCDAGRCEGAPEPQAFQACAGPAGGLGLNSKCSTGCCLTVAPVPNGLNVGAGLCVDAGLCSAAIEARACSGPSAGAAPNAKCGSGCCYTLIPKTSGLCIPSQFCS